MQPLAHDVRHKATESKVRAACRFLQQKREVLTQAAIARVAGLSRQTVAAYKHVLTEVLKPAVVAVLGVVAPKPDIGWCASGICPRFPRVLTLSSRG